MTADLSAVFLVLHANVDMRVLFFAYIHPSNEFLCIKKRIICIKNRISQKNIKNFEYLCKKRLTDTKSVI